MQPMGPPTVASELSEVDDPQSEDPFSDDDNVVTD